MDTNNQAIKSQATNNQTHISNSEWFDKPTLAIASDLINPP